MNSLSAVSAGTYAAEPLPDDLADAVLVTAFRVTRPVTMLPDTGKTGRAGR